MSVSHGNTRRATSLLSALHLTSLVLLAGVWAGGCNSDGEVVGPGPEPGGPPAELLGSAIRLHVDLRGGNVTVTQPSLVEAPTTRDGLEPSFALLGRNEIEAEVTEVSRSALGEFTYNRVRVTLSLALTNKLLNADLVPSTFPRPPSGVAQVVAFPFSTDPAGLFGLKVRASPDWNGAPHNFFNDAICIVFTPPGDCFRWEGFGAELAAGETTEPQTVGFDVDASVTEFTVYVVVAADIEERPIPPGQGGIAGIVSEDGRPGLQGVTVRVGEDGPTAETNVNGFYTLGGLDPGDVLLSLENLPEDCETPTGQTATVIAGDVVTINFNVSCPDPVGTITGTVTSPQLGALAGIQVNAGGHQAITNEDGSFVIGDVIPGEYLLVLGTGLPVECEPGRPAGIGIRVEPGAATNHDFVIPCATSSIAAARAAADGTQLVITGSVSASFQSAQPGRFKTYIQDAGGGIAVFPTGDLPMDTQVEVGGVRTTVGGEVQISVATLTDQGLGEPLLARLIGSTEINDGSAEGELVQLQNLRVIGTVSSEVVTVRTFDGLAVFQLRQSLLDGDCILAATGVLTREFGALRLRPRFSTDVVTTVGGVCS